MKCLKVALWTGVVMLGPSIGSADWADSFSGGVVHQPWLFFDEDGVPPPDFTSVETGDEALLFEGRAAALATGNFDEFAAGFVGLGVPAYSFQGVRLRASVRSTPNVNFQGMFTDGNNNSFIFVRSSPTLTSYLLAIDWAEPSLDLERVNTGQVLTDLDDSTVANFNINKTYTIELAAVGSTILGSLYDGAELVARTKAIDTTYTSGWSGLGSSINVNDAYGTARTLIAAEFDNVLSISIVAGDINIDGAVDRSDAALFAGYYGLTFGSEWTTGDFNSDGRTSLADWALLRSNLGYGAPSPDAAPVPEPSSLALLVLGILLLPKRRLITALRTNSLA
ncbi:MAG: dockerin type I domain-containing protein [Pirellulales bacterium]